LISIRKDQNFDLNNKAEKYNQVKML